MRSAHLHVAEMDERTSRLIHGLWELGLETGDRIAMLSGNHHERLAVIA